MSYASEGGKIGATTATIMVSCMLGVAVFLDAFCATNMALDMGVALAVTFFIAIGNAIGAVAGGTLAIVTH